MTFAFILVAYRRRFSMRRRSIFVFVFPPFTSEDRAVISQRTAAALLAIVASAPKSHADFRRNFARRCTARISDYSRGSGPVKGCLRYHQRASSDGPLFRILSRSRKYRYFGVTGAVRLEVAGSGIALPASDEPHSFYCPALPAGRLARSDRLAAIRSFSSAPY